MKRNPRLLRWTKASRVRAGKEMVCDTTLQFEARRDVPIRYNRDLMNKTLEAMKRVSEIRARRERIFYKKRMVGKKERELARARKLVAENEHLLPRMRGSELKKLREAAAEGAMEIDEEELLQDARNVKRKSQVFGGEARKIKVRIDDGVEEDAME
jgi:large subunit ribosomal protein L24e